MVVTVFKTSTAIQAIEWCSNNIGPIEDQWDFKTNLDKAQYQFTFKNAVDATWFALVHRDKLV